MSCSCDDLVMGDVCGIGLPSLLRAGDRRPESRRFLHRDWRCAGLGPRLELDLLRALRRVARVARRGEPVLIFEAHDAQAGRVPDRDCAVREGRLRLF